MDGWRIGLLVAGAALIVGSLVILPRAARSRPDLRVLMTGAAAGVLVGAGLVIILAIT